MPTDTKKTRCINWMNLDRVIETVRNYNSQWGAPDEPEFILSDFDMAKNCSECNMRPKFTGVTEELMQVCGMFKDPVITKLEEVGMIRKCYKADKKE